LIYCELAVDLLGYWFVLGWLLGSLRESSSSGTVEDVDAFSAILLGLDESGCVGVCFDAMTRLEQINC
jgi:hypothetical protein